MPTKLRNLADAAWNELATQGVGRFRREAYVLRLGEYDQIDIDELRSYHMGDILISRLKHLREPLTAEETLFLVMLVGGAGPVTQQHFIQNLFNLVCCEKQPAHVPLNTREPDERVITLRNDNAF